MFGIGPAEFIIFAVWVVFIVILGVLALLIPFFILRIRNEIIKLNETMSLILAELERIAGG